MPERRVWPDIEQILVAYLSADTGFNTLVGGRISTELPSDFKAEKRLQLFLNPGGGYVDQLTKHLARPALAVLSFGSTKGEAMEVIQQALLLLDAASQSSHEAAVITDFGVVVGPSWSPDDPTDIPRYIAQVILTVHSIAS